MNKNIEGNYDSFQEYNINYLIEYIRENFIGLLLLIIVFLIIYVVDYITHINTLSIAMANAVPGMPQIANFPKMRKGKKFKK